MAGVARSRLLPGSHTSESVVEPTAKQTYEKRGNLRMSDRQIVKEFDVHSYVMYMQDKYSAYDNWVTDQGVPTIAGFFVAMPGRSRSPRGKPKERSARFSRSLISERAMHTFSRFPLGKARRFNGNSLRRWS